MNDMMAGQRSQALVSINGGASSLSKREEGPIQVVSAPPLIETSACDSDVTACTSCCTIINFNNITSFLNLMSF